MCCQSGGIKLNTFQTFWNGLDWTVLRDMLISVIPALVCITLHELSHGFVALKLGDTTAKDAGRLTFNPIKHIDIFGLLMMIVFHFGWAKPVPVDMRRFKNPKTGMAICAAAGPACNLILSCILLIIYGLVFFPLVETGSEWAFIVLDTVGTTAYLSLALAVFNILPISPLDGSKVLFSFLKPQQYYKLMRYERYGMIVLIIIMATDILGDPLSTVTGWLYDKLFFLAEFGGDIFLKIF